MIRSGMRIVVRKTRDIRRILALTGIIIAKNELMFKRINNM